MAADQSASNNVGAAKFSIPQAPLRAASIPNLVEHVV
eukprot:SAG31_NODE_44378_length_263_cov_0.621951_1_plen_36_part_01